MGGLQRGRIPELRPIGVLGGHVDVLRRPPTQRIATREHAQVAERAGGQRGNHQEAVLLDAARVVERRTEGRSRQAGQVHRAEPGVVAHAHGHRRDVADLNLTAGARDALRRVVPDQAVDHHRPDRRHHRHLHHDRLDVRLAGRLGHAQANRVALGVEGRRRVEGHGGRVAAPAIVRRGGRRARRGRRLQVDRDRLARLGVGHLEDASLDGNLQARADQIHVLEGARVGHVELVLRQGRDGVGRRLDRRVDRVTQAGLGEHVGHREAVRHQAGQRVGRERQRDGEHVVLVEGLVELGRHRGQVLEHRLDQRGGRLGLQAAGHAQHATRDLIEAQGDLGDVHGEAGRLDRVGGRHGAFLADEGRQRAAVQRRDHAGHLADAEARHADREVAVRVGLHGALGAQGAAGRAGGLAGQGVDHLQLGLFPGHAAQGDRALQGRELVAHGGRRRRGDNGGERRVGRDGCAAPAAGQGQCRYQRSAAGEPTGHDEFTSEERLNSLSAGDFYFLC